MNAKQQARLERLMERVSNAKNFSDEAAAREALDAYMVRLMDHEGVPLDDVMNVVHPV